MLTLHPSQSDLASKCAESLGGDLKIRLHSLMADMGGAAHAAWRLLPERDPNIDEIAKQYDVDADELGMLVNCFRRDWKAHNLERWFKDSSRELQLIAQDHGFTVVGTLDRVKAKGKEAFVLDGKSGWLESPHVHQIRAYAWLVCRNYRDVERVWAAVLYPRLGVLDPVWLTREQLDEWWGNYRDRLTRGIGTFTPGAHCRFCRRQDSCDAAATHRQAAIVALSKNGTAIDLNGDPKEIGPQIAQGMAWVRQIEELCKTYREASGAYVDRHGAVPAGEGRLLKRMTRNLRSLDSQRAWPILRKRFSDDEIAHAMKLQLTKLEQTVKESVPHGEGAAAIREFDAELEAAEAIHRHEADAGLREINA